MKVFLLLSAIPYEKGEAIEVVSYEIVRLMALQGVELDVQVIIREGTTTKTQERETYVKNIFDQEVNVSFLPVIYLGDIDTGKTRLGYTGIVLRSLPLLRQQINSSLFPGTEARPIIHKRVKQCASDVIVSIWSWESLAASYDVPNIPKFVYYGNPNHKPVEAQLNYPDLFGMQVNGFRGGIKHRVHKLVNQARKIQHIKMMAHCEVTSNNSMVDTLYYRDSGHPNSIYLQNMWPETSSKIVFGGESSKAGPKKIAASVGNLGATGNTFGLYYLATKVAPKLEQQLGIEKIVLDVYGHGKAGTKVEQVLNHPSIVRHGWVDDINQEINNSVAFLVLTNVDDFIVGNTRILLAWSLGACVIAHTNSALSMPELEHGKNILLGETADDIVALIKQVVDTPALGEKIGRGGYNTFQEYYMSSKVVPKMLVQINKCVNEYKSNGDC